MEEKRKRERLAVVEIREERKARDILGFQIKAQHTLYPWTFL